jgi:hypothetical protein
MTGNRLSNWLKQLALSFVGGLGRFLSVLLLVALFSIVWVGLAWLGFEDFLESGSGNGADAPLFVGIVTVVFVIAVFFLLEKWKSNKRNRCKRSQ